MNSVCLIGRTTADIELRTTQSGKSVASFTLAVRKYDSKAIFIKCVAWGKTAEIASEHVRKGNKVGVVGSIDVGSYDRKDGTKSEVFEVVVESLEFLESKPRQESSNEFHEIPDTENDLPF